MLGVGAKKSNNQLTFFSLPQVLNTTEFFWLSIDPNAAKYSSWVLLGFSGLSIFVGSAYLVVLAVRGKKTEYESIN